MRAIRLIIEPFEFISLLEVEYTKEMNAHGIFRASGIVSETNREIYQKFFYEECFICLKAITEDGSEHILFRGVLTNGVIQVEGQVYRLVIEAQTGSYLLDRKPHTRLYQDASMSYESVMKNSVLESGGNILMIDKYQEMIGGFIVQYQETDWAFCKRLANHLGLPLLPEFREAGKLIHIGINNKSGEPLESQEFSLGLSQKELKKINSLIWHEEGIYKVKSREIHQLGEHLFFNGKRLTVGKIESVLEGSELWHNYFLCVLKTESDSIYFNQKIQGISMRGKVLAVQGTKVQIFVYQDENQTQGGRWFEYATVYSTPDGTGWYCMPEVGDEIRLTFPTDDENLAYVAGSVHLDGGAGRNNPDQKFWRNKWGKEIRFTPNTLLFTNNNGLTILLDDDTGIQISSDKGIYLTGAKGISLNSQTGIQISGNNKVSIQQGFASIKMDDEINISGGKISLN